MSIGETHKRLRLLERFITVLREPSSAYPNWKRIVVTHGVSGRQVHDARLVALMNAYRITRILTLNDADFARYKGVRALTPDDVVAT